MIYLKSVFKFDLVSSIIIGNFSILALNTACLLDKGTCNKQPPPNVVL